MIFELSVKTLRTWPVIGLEDFPKNEGRGCNLTILLTLNFEQVCKKFCSTTFENFLEKF